ncbi:MAG: ParB N-terminal domain-containing protein [Candidatus Sericytochromatia bacterium]
MGNLNVSEIIKSAQKTSVDISCIRVPDYHDRTDVDDENIESLANNMSEVGQLSPILLDKKSDDNFDLISGLRRFEAALKLNWSEIDAIILEDLDEASRMLIMIAENAQRQDINDYDLIVSLVHFISISVNKTDDEVKAFLLKLRNHDLGNVKSLTFEEKKLKKSMEEVLSKTDKYSLNFVANKLKVLNFAPVIIRAMKENKLLYTYALILNKVKDEQVLNDLIHKFITKQIDKDELKKEIKKYIGSNSSPSIVPFSTTLKKLRDFKNLSEEVQEAVMSKMAEIEEILAS